MTLVDVLVVLVCIAVMPFAIMGLIVAVACVSSLLVVAAALALAAWDELKAWRKRR